MPEKKPQLSVREFRKLLREQLEKVAAENGWNMDKASDRGFSLQVWMAERIEAYEQGYDTSPSDAILFSKDLKADLVFDDPVRQHMLIVQCKYQGEKKLVDESEVNDFFQRHKKFMVPEWVNNHGSAAASSALGDYKDKVEDGCYTITYRFVSTGRASDRVRELAELCNDEYTKEGLPVTCELMDFQVLKEYFIQSQSLEVSGPSEVRFRVPKDQFIVKNEPYPTLVAVIKGNMLRNLYRRYKESLYAWNIRGYLGNRGINHEISTTARERSGDFFYFNNGISAICTHFVIENGNELVAKNFQIINGAQTITSLSKAPQNSDLEVLFRLTRTRAVKTESGINRDIIQYNNSQNAIKVSDFRSNDPIQVHLEHRFKDRRPRGPHKKRIRYLRRRAVGGGAGIGLKLEELAKVRYAFLVEPTRLHADPKSLWTPKENGGCYHLSFGVNERLEAVWSAEVFEETLLSLAFYYTIDSRTKELAKMDQKQFRRLRYHLLALAGVYSRENLDATGVHDCTRKAAKFDAHWNRICEAAFDVVEDVYTHAVEDNDMTMFAFVRNEEKWGDMKKRFARKMARRRFSA